MRTESAAVVIGRIERALGSAPGERGVIAFDGDGTLWSGDVGNDFFHAFVAHRDLRAPALGALRDDARRFGIDDGGDAATLAQRLYDAQGSGAYPEERACEMIAWLAAGWSRAELDAFCARLVESAGVARRLHPEVGEVLAWAAANPRIEVFTVSASPRAIVAAAVPLAGIAPARVLAVESEWHGDAMRASVIRPIPYGPGKVANLEGRLAGRTLIAAFGDNAFDVDMLARSEVPVAVRPKARLRARAGEVAALVELASPVAAR